MRAREIEFGYNQEWSSLYQTWNLAYVTGTGVHFINHKLLQPMVNNKKTVRYMDTRVVALNNALNLWFLIVTILRFFTNQE